MSFTDIVLRRGHLSEEALAEVWMSGHRPPHLDRCQLCSARALEMSRWLEDVRDLGVADADAAFPAERLVAQQAQILRKLEKLDRPSRVVTFPAQQVAADLVGRRLQTGWLSLAAAAGLVLGVMGGEASHWVLGTRPAHMAFGPAVSSSAVQMGGMNLPSAATEAESLFEAIDRPNIDALDVLDNLTPRHTNQALLRRQ